VKFESIESKPGETSVKDAFESKIMNPQHEHAAATASIANDDDVDADKAIPIATTMAKTPTIATIPKKTPPTNTTNK
jgi:hypothetical protein